jgi:hypothetical protein
MASDKRPEDTEYAFMKVRPSRDFTDKQEAFEDIKALLKLAAPDIDENFGARRSPGRPSAEGQTFLVLVEKNTAWKLLGENHPNVLTVHDNHKYDALGPTAEFHRSSGRPGRRPGSGSTRPSAPSTGAGSGSGSGSVSRPGPGNDPEDPRYAIVTVSRPDPSKPVTADTYQEIKAALGLESPKIDDVYGAIPASKSAPNIAKDHPGAYFVLIKPDEAQRLLEEKHPNVIGIFHAAMVPSGQGPRPLDPERLKKSEQRRFRSGRRF